MKTKKQKKRIAKFLKNLNKLNRQIEIDLVKFQIDAINSYKKRSQK